MNSYIITQIRNESTRLEEWIKYHTRLGFNKFFIFNDKSTDNSLQLLYTLSNNYNIEILNTDGGGEYLENNPNVYGDSISTIQRVIRSYNRGLNLIKLECDIDTDWCAIIDVDEYIVPQIDNNITDAIKRFDNSRITIPSYDYKCPFDLSKPIISQTYMRWSDNTRNTGVVYNTIGHFKERFKSLFKISEIHNIKHIHNMDCDETKRTENKDILKINHYRNDSLLQVFDYEDRTIEKFI